MTIVGVPVPPQSSLRSGTSPTGEPTFRRCRWDEGLALLFRFCSVAVPSPPELLGEPRSAFLAASNGLLSYHVGAPRTVGRTSGPIPYSPIYFSTFVPFAPLRFPIFLRFSAVQRADGGSTGRRTVNTDPSPTSLWTSMEPSRLSTYSRTIHSPSPRPWRSSSTARSKRSKIF